MATQRETVERVLDQYGQTFAEELGVNVQRNKPSPLFRLLCFSLLASARISHEIAMKAAKSLAKTGWTTPRHMQEATWADRTKVLNRSGYARYDESTSRMLEETAGLLVDKYGGDLRTLHEQSGGDIDQLRRSLEEFKGIGPAGADLFLREVQLAWDDIYPFIDSRATKMAERLGLPGEAKPLARLANGPQSYVRLVDGLVRAGFDDCRRLQ